MHCAYFTSLACRSFELTPPDPAPEVADGPPQAATPSAAAATTAASSAVLLPHHDTAGGLTPAAGRVLFIVSTLVSFRCGRCYVIRCTKEEVTARSATL